MAKQVIPSIHIPIQEKDGSISWVWYMFLKYLSSIEGGSGASSLSQLSDVNISSPTNNQYLVYDNGIWKNQTLSISWGQIGGDIEDQVDLKNALDSKQNVLTAGTNITIDENNVISATGDSLPDQTGNAGKFLTTNGTDASWGNLKITSTQVIVGTTWNVAPYTVLVGVNSYSWTTSANYGVAVGYTAACYTYSVAVGANSIASGDYSIAVGYHATAPGNNSITIGAEAHSGARNSVCIGYDAETTSNAQNAIQIGSGVNRVANTLMVANGNGNFEMMSADGTIPEARLADTTSATEGQVLTLDANGNAKWEDASSGSSYHPDLFDWKWADHQLDDVQWLRADTFSWQSGSVYESAYQHLVDDIDGKTLQSETIGSTTIQFYLADDGHKICPASEETNVTAIYNATGVAWYYIIDTVNERFKLPRTKFGVTGLRDNVGDYVEPELPNIVARLGGTISWARDNPFYGSGNTGSCSGSNYGMQNTMMDLSRVNSIFKNGATVQPPATQMYLYFYVGEFTQTALENTAGVVTEDFNELNAHKVIAFQAPTAQNNYTWYRKYADGWVEQGGVTGAQPGTAITVTFPITMANTEYFLTVNSRSDENDTGGYGDVKVGINGTGTYSFGQATTGFRASTINEAVTKFSWRAEGMAAQ